jgi:uncharacterized protein (TIGR04562 family)
MADINLLKLSPEITHVVLGGNAYIDLDALSIHSHECARDFVFSYGFDVGLPHHRSQIVKTFKGAIAFLERLIFEKADLKVPAKITGTKDPLNLLIWASEMPRTDIARWSCAILRIMHSLFYIDNSIALKFIPDIHQQILERYDRYIVQKANGKWLLKGEYEVPIVEVRRKERKNRDSMLLKLLHKPENVAETIYDNIGIRIVAEDLLGVLLVLWFLIDHNVIQAAHIKPSRTRNLMIDPVLLEEWIGTLPKNFSVDALSPSERRDICEKLAQRIGKPAVNPHSSRDYSALQVTANTLVRLPVPSIHDLAKIQDTFGQNKFGTVGHNQMPNFLQAQEGRISFFFAHEVQIMEKSGFNSSHMGPASHSEYKRRQREVVRKRLLRGLLPQKGAKEAGNAEHPN